MALISHRSFVTEIKKKNHSEYIYRQYILKRIRYLLALRQKLTVQSITWIQTFLNNLSNNPKRTLALITDAKYILLLQSEVQ
jgi:hypothetical protein